MRNTSVLSESKSIDEKVNNKDLFDLEKSNNFEYKSTYKYQTSEVEKFIPVRNSLSQDKNFLKEYQDYIYGSAVKPIVENDEIIFDEISGKWKLIKESENYKY